MKKNRSQSPLGEGALQGAPPKSVRISRGCKAVFHSLAFRRSSAAQKRPKRDEFLNDPGEITGEANFEVF